MTQCFLTRDQVRQIDRRAVDEFGLLGLVLMENAGRACADVLCELGVTGTVVICCGKGNNGGDGFVMARHLEARGHRVKVLYWSDPQGLPPDATANHAILVRAATPLINLAEQPNADALARELEGAQWIVDALLGIGARGELRPPFDKVIQQLNDHPARKFAVDLPSGLDCDTGEAATRRFARITHVHWSPRRKAFETTWHSHSLAMCTLSKSVSRRSCWTK